MRTGPDQGPSIRKIDSLGPFYFLGQDLLLFLEALGEVVFDSRSGRTFTYATPIMKGDLSVSALKDSGGSRGHGPPLGYRGVVVNSRVVDLLRRRPLGTF